MVIGVPMEWAFGHGYFLFCFLANAVLGNLYCSYNKENIAFAGSQPAYYGLWGMFTAYIYMNFTRIRAEIRPILILTLVLFLAASYLFRNLSDPSPANVIQATAYGGYISGLLLGTFLAPEVGSYQKRWRLVIRTIVRYLAFSAWIFLLCFWSFDLFYSRSIVDYTV